jgi:hypothetical protein
VLKAETPHGRNSFQKSIDMRPGHIARVSIFAMSELVAGLEAGINSFEVYDTFQRQVTG